MLTPVGKDGRTMCRRFANLCENGAPERRALQKTIAFESLRLARAFIGHFGGVMVDEREVHDALAGEAANEDAASGRT